MRIANPIYDSVFKYLLSDPEIARLVISTITELDIDSVEIRNSEQIGRFSPVLSVFRLDFCARIRLANGDTQMVLIEIQKAKFPEDIMRFRRYLGEQYADKTNVVTELKNGRKVQTPLPIISIYFLGHQLEGITAPVIKVRRQYFDAITREELKCRAQFIECLSHDSFVIQIPLLKEPARTRLETLLSFFDQHRADPRDEHQLILEEDRVPQEFRGIARSLMRAGESFEVRKDMTLEDDFLEDILNLERDSLARAEQAEADKQKAEADKQKAEADKQKAEADKQKAEADKQKAEADKQKAETDKQKAEAQLQAALQSLIAQGMSPEEARRLLGL
ncbi:MAG: hypothetical protein RL095_3674 [Verrucomicrobiota bacterium]|jgi:hypothetical protein